MKRKSKGEQLFILLISIVCFGMIFITGCGGNSCETVKCGSEEEEGLIVKGISVPGCGGCLSSGQGCDSCWWSQSCKFIYIDDNSAKILDEKPAKLLACDNQYYGDGCLGCAQNLKSSYSACSVVGADNWFCVYGSTDSGEDIVGVVDGCFSCTGCMGCSSGSYFGIDEYLYQIEWMEDID